MATLYVFSGGRAGAWDVRSMTTLAGPELEPVPSLAVSSGPPDQDDGAAWRLRGVAGHARYANRAEVATLRSRQAGLDRPEATRAALIPIAKSAAWWDLAQDERRIIFEETSHHTRIGLDYLPAVARRLHHGRDLGEPFDFLTWFEFAPEHEPAFDAMLIRLRATAEWRYVTREIDIRLGRR